MNIRLRHPWKGGAGRHRKGGLVERKRERGIEDHASIESHLIEPYAIQAANEHIVLGIFPAQCVRAGLKIDGLKTPVRLAIDIAQRAAIIEDDKMVVTGLGGRLPPEIQTPGTVQRGFDPRLPTRFNRRTARSIHGVASNIRNEEPWRLRRKTPDER